MTVALRTEPQLLRQMAATLCLHPWYCLSDALHEVMADEDPARWQNLLAALSVALDLPPINAYDQDRALSHPAAYATRVCDWADSIGNALLTADRLRLLARRAEQALTDTSRARVGGRAYVLMGATT